MFLPGFTFNNDSQRLTLAGRFLLTVSTPLWITRVAAVRPDREAHGLHTHTRDIDWLYLPL